jgi:7-carboxy-7-deazaguanine synthase
MHICEIFKSIQGEGRFLGRQAIFIRTMGCNLDCNFCDTKKTWDEEQLDAGRELTLAEIIAEVNFLCPAVKIHKSDLQLVDSYRQTLVVITGGEPCIQPNLGELIDRLACDGYYVAIETNGTLGTPIADWVTCSPKAAANYMVAPVCFADELKFVVTPEFQLSVVPEHVRDRFAGNIWLQPEGSDMQHMWTKCYNLVQEDPRFRVGVQLHKLMEVL